jgi:hypothetical protein
MITDEAVDDGYLARSDEGVLLGHGSHPVLFPMLRCSHSELTFSE